MAASDQLTTLPLVGPKPLVQSHWSEPIGHAEAHDEWAAVFRGFSSEVMLVVFHGCVPFPKRESCVSKFRGYLRLKASSLAL